MGFLMRDEPRASAPLNALATMDGMSVAYVNFCHDRNLDAYAPSTKGLYSARLHIDSRSLGYRLGDLHRKDR